MYDILKPLLFTLSPEKAHHFVTTTLKSLFKVWGVKYLVQKSYTIHHPILTREVAGLRFKNPVGLAAGFDKNASYIEEMAAFGFGFIEIGTVTPRPQPGNEQPRMFRLPKDEALINRMGFNNQGVDVAATRLRHLKRPEGLIIGGNIGKNKDTPNDQAIQDYLYCFDSLFEVVDYFVVNVSSPNTPGLRDLQEKGPLMAILNTLQQRNQAKSTAKPIFLKIAPDLTDSQLDDIIDIVQTTKIAGVIATNTTISRAHLKSPAEITQEAGGLSGKPLSKRSTEVIAYLHQKSEGSFPIIGVGGIQDKEDARDKLAAGACLIQLYTGFIYEGPGLVKDICEGLIKNQGYEKG
jgi:dihydroorotate dehydrogenase